MTTDLWRYIVCFNVLYTVALYELADYKMIPFITIQTKDQKMKNEEERHYVIRFIRISFYILVFIFAPLFFICELWRWATNSPKSIYRYKPSKEELNIDGS
jgi:hypothetical protein